MTNEEFKRKFARLTPENQEALLEYIKQLLEEQKKEEQK